GSVTFSDWKLYHSLSVLEIQHLKLIER
ncbi:unnamed protein product, partial [Allacma fusca]